MKNESQNAKVENEAGVVELVYTMDSKPIAARLESSSLSSGTKMVYSCRKTMFSTRFLVVVLLLGVLLPSSSFAASKTTVLSDPLADATVNLYCRIKLGGNTYGSTGSGVFVGDKGVILTNAHVAQYFLLSEGKSKGKANCSVRTGSPAKAQYEAKLLYISPGWLEAYRTAVKNKTPNVGTGEQDFALLYVTKAKRGKLPASFPSLSYSDILKFAEVKEGDDVTVAGYPAGNLTFEDIEKRLKRVTAESTITGIRSFTRPFTDILVVGPSVAGQTGVSGGPVVDDDKNIVGIVTTLGSDKEKGLKSVRAISTSYIDRTVRAHTGLSFKELFTGDLALRASTTSAAITSEMRKTLETAIRRVR
jgi:S1-C subfamily serine protease